MDPEYRPIPIPQLRARHTYVLNRIDSHMSTLRERNNAALLEKVTRKVREERQTADRAPACADSKRAYWEMAYSRAIQIWATSQMLR